MPDYLLQPKARRRRKDPVHWVTQKEKKLCLVAKCKLTPSRQYLALESGERILPILRDNGASSAQEEAMLE